jgi:hypothetical protein
VKKGKIILENHFFLCCVEELREMAKKLDEKLKIDLGVERKVER